jgi:hypothetical protein
MFERRLLPDPLLPVHQVDDAKDKHVGHVAAEEIAGGEIRLVYQRGAHIGEDLGERRRRRHQHNPDPQPTQTGELRDLIAIAGQFRPSINDHRRAQQKDRPRQEPFKPDHLFLL